METPTAAAIHSRETHSCTEWKLWPPAKTLGVRMPMKERREPSVPPRMALRMGVMPWRVKAEVDRKIG